MAHDTTQKVTELKHTANVNLPILRADIPIAQQIEDMQAIQAGLNHAIEILKKIEKKNG